MAKKLNPRAVNSADEVLAVYGARLIEGGAYIVIDLPSIEEGAQMVWHLPFNYKTAPLRESIYRLLTDLNESVCFSYFKGLTVSPYLSKSVAVLDAIYDGLCRLDKRAGASISLAL